MLRATPAISHSTCLSKKKKKKSGAPTGVGPTKVRTRWRRIEEPRSSEERKAGRRRGHGQGFAAASHLHLHPNSFQVAVRFLENQSPRSALPRSFLSFPQSASRPPECRCAPSLRGWEAPVKNHTPGCLPQHAVSFLQQPPAESWVPTTPSKPDAFPSPAPPLPALGKASPGSPSISRLDRSPNPRPP